MTLILVDGYCNLCDRAVKFLIRHDTCKQLQFVAMQSDKGQRLLQHYSISLSLQSVVVIKDGQLFLKSDAMIQACSSLNGWPFLLSYMRFIPRFLRNWIYDCIARNRYKLFGKKEACKLY